MSLEDFSEMKDDVYALDARLIREHLGHFCDADNDGSPTVVRVRKYYRNEGPLVWVDALGTDFRGDTLLATLRARLHDMGFSEKPFCVRQISEDLERMRTLTFDTKNDINRVAARLEYNLTKAYMRYVSGQRFGFVNPNYVLNRFDPREQDSTGHVRSYRHLFDVDMEHPDDAYTEKALRRAVPDSLGMYLRRVEPKGDLYRHLQTMLQTVTDSQRQRILVNMERCRWRGKLQPAKDEKYVLVNVPAFHLWAVGPDSVVDMRVACGALKTKTPLLSSRITHMEVNPEWSIPMSIIRDDVARHGGDSGYFARRRYYIVDKKTGRRISPRNVSASMLRSGNYRVAQQGGAGNSLGRIIFRFPNNFSVFLHDTSSPGAFGRDNRGVSHGCVRVQKPFSLAVFLMEKDPDEWLLDKLRISMGMSPETDQGREYIDGLAPGTKAPRLISSLKVFPRVPIIITYYTIFQTPDGTVRHYPDVYGYDKAIGEALKTYIQ
jgi:murein L,D-transpeptidase YcbB/YkuD